MKSAFLAAAFVPLALPAAHAGARAGAPPDAQTLAERTAAPAQPKAAQAGVEAAGIAPTPGSPVTRWRPLVAEASRRFGVPIAWIEQVMRAESGGHTRLNGRPITSPAGAMGLMQLMPATWSDLRAALALGADPYDPHDNVLAGTAYLAALYRRFGYPGLFAAYNAGPARYAAWLAGRGPLPAETRLYLAQVRGEEAPGALFAGRDLPSAAIAPADAKPARSALRERLFPVDRAGGSVAGPTADEPGEGLFVALSRAASPAAED